MHRIPLDPEMVKELRTAAAIADGASAYQCWLDFLRANASDPVGQSLLDFAAEHSDLVREIFVYGYCSAQVDNERKR